MKEDLSYIISELCFEFGEGFPEKNEDNFDGEWFNLSYYNFNFRVSDIILNCIGDIEGSLKSTVMCNGKLVYQCDFDYDIDESPCPNGSVYIPGEWEEIIRRKYNYYFANSGYDQILFDFAYLTIKSSQGEQMSFAEISDEFYF